MCGPRQVAPTPPPPLPAAGRVAPGWAGRAGQPEGHPGAAGCQRSSLRRLLLCCVGLASAVPRGPGVIGTEGRQPGGGLHLHVEVLRAAPRLPECVLPRGRQSSIRRRCCWHACSLSSCRCAERLAPKSACFSSTSGWLAVHGRCLQVRVGLQQALELVAADEAAAKAAGGSSGEAEAQAGGSADEDSKPSPAAVAEAVEAALFALHGECRAGAGLLCRQGPCCGPCSRGRGPQRP